MAARISCCLWRFPISDRDPDCMEIFAYTDTEVLLWDYSETEEHYVLVKPPVRRVRTLYRVPQTYAYQWFGLNGGNNLKIIYYPFAQTHFRNLTNPCDCPPEEDAYTATVTVSPSSVIEDSGIPLVFTISLDRASADVTTIDFTLTGTAAEGSDYPVVNPHSVTIAAGQTSAQVSITPIADVVYFERTETVILTVTGGVSGSGLISGGATATGGIVELLPLPIITLVDPSDGDPTNIITVTGQWFTDATLVTFVGNTALSSTASFVFVNDTTLTVTVPPWPGGTSALVDIRVTTPSGISAITVDDVFFYDNLYLWPEDSVDWQLLVSAANPARIWGVSGYLATVNTTASPARVIQPPYAYDLSDNDINNDNWGGSSVPGLILQDSNYVYYVSNNKAVVSRVPVGGTFADIQTLTIAAGFGTNGPIGVGSNGTSPQSIYNSVIRDGKMYLPWAGRWNGVYPTMGMLVIDLVAWNPAGFNFYAYSTDLVNLPAAWGLCITDNGTIVISTLVDGTPPVNGRIYYSNIATPSTWNFIAIANVQPAYGVSKGDYAYFLERFHNTSGIASRSTKLVVVNCTAGVPTLNVVNMTDDPNFLTIDQGSSNFCSFPWVSDTHLFVSANYTRLLAGGFPPAHHSISESPYIAKRALVTGAAAGGSFLKNLLPWDWEFLIDSSTFYNGTHYIVYYSWGYDSRYITVDEALTTATIWPNPQITNPSANNLFANAVTISVGATLAGNSYYATYETNEQTPINWPSTFEYAFKPEHTVWYKFVAPSTDAFNIVVSKTQNLADVNYISVWIGSAIGSLTLVTEHLPTGNTIASLLPPRATCLLPATGGVTYYIRISQFPAPTWFEGIAGLPLIDAEEGSKFTVTIQPAQTTRQSMVFTPGLGGVYNYSVQWSPERDHMNAGTFIREDS